MKTLDQQRETHDTFSSVSLPKQMNLADELCKLTELHETGDLTDQEFADAKRHVIADTRAEPPPLPKEEQTVPGRAAPPLPQQPPQRTQPGWLHDFLFNNILSFPGRLAPSLPQQSPQRKESGFLRAFLIFIGLVFGLFIVLAIIGSLLNPSGSQSSSSGSQSSAPATTVTSAQGAANWSSASQSNAPVTTTTSAERAAAPVTTPQERPISWREIDSIYNLMSKKTDLQKDEAWKRYKGKRVTWSGEVTAVSEGWLGGLTMQVKMNRDTFTSDLLINLKEGEKPKAAQLHEGDKVRFTGILEDWGSLLPITLDDGEIAREY